MASALHEPITGVWGRAPNGAKGIAPKAERHSLFDAQKESEIWPRVRDFCSSFEIVPTEQVFLPNRYHDLQIG